MAGGCERSFTPELYYMCNMCNIRIGLIFPAPVPLCLLLSDGSGETGSLSDVPTKCPIVDCERAR